MIINQFFIGLLIIVFIDHKQSNVIRDSLSVTENRKNINTYQWNYFL